MSRSINLLPDQVIDTQRKASRIYQGTVLSIIGLIIFILLNLILLFFASQVERTLQVSEAHASTLQQEIKTFEPLETKLAILRDYLSNFQRFNKTSIDIEDFWNKLTEMSKDKVSIVTFDYVDQDASNLRASTDSLANAVAFLLLLKSESESFGTFRITEVQYEGGTKQFFFNILFVYQ